MPVLCVGEVHFSSIERMQIRDLFSIGQFFTFLRETFILALREHGSLWGNWVLDPAVARQLMGQLVPDHLQLGQAVHPFSEDSQFPSF